MKLSMWMEFFDDLQNIKGRSINTIKAYRRDLELFAQYNKPDDILGFYEFMGKKRLSNRSQARVISSLRTYFKFLQSRGREVLQIQELHLPKVKNSVPKAISQKEFQILYEVCESKCPNKTARNKLMLLLLYGLGCRVTELISLDITSFSPTQGYLKVLGKGEKERLVPLTENIMKELDVYLSHVRPHILKSSSRAILINDRGKRLSRVDVWRWLAAWSKKAGFDKPMSPHKFRHGCATALLDSGANLRSIQMLLGHSSIQTTQIYTDVTTQNMKVTIDKYHPLSKKK